MNGILGFASLLLTADLRPEHRKQVRIIQSSGRSLLALVNDILDISKLEVGTLQLDDVDFSIEEVVSGVVNLLRGTAAAKHLEMSVYLDTRLPEYMRGDDNRLRQVLTNLVGNAIKFTDSGGIGIEVCEVSGVGEAAVGDSGAGRALQLSVSDTGIGIPADQQERVFEQFTRIENSARRRAEGTGLGLAICKQLVEMMGGRIWVQSTLGVGSTFSLRIPLKEAVPPVAESEWHRRAVSRLSGRRVLVLEHDSINRRILHMQIESYGMRVDDEAGAVKALRLLRWAVDTGDPYAVAVIGHRMPEMDGVDLARRIRADARIAGVSLLLNTSSGTYGMDEARELGFDAIEERPVLPHTLVETLCGLLHEPSAQGNGAVPSPDAAASGVAGDADGARILLVENSPVGQQLVLEMLSLSPHRVDVVGNGREAVQAASRRSGESGHSVVRRAGCRSSS